MGWDIVFCKVLAISKTAVTVTVTNNFNNKKVNSVLTFPFHVRLASGSYNLLEGDSYSYKRDDLKAGDDISLRYIKLDGKIERDYRSRRIKNHSFQFAGFGVTGRRRIYANSAVTSRAVLLAATPARIVSG